MVEVANIYRVSIPKDKEYNDNIPHITGIDGFTNSYEYTSMYI